ncbi:hypothetical protein [Chondromyces crocatus]|nr:hypothetical protein [Chondromyces crocatus]
MRSRHLPRLASALLGLAAARSAAAQGTPSSVMSSLEEELSVFDPPAPPTLPGLTRRDLTFTFETTIAVIDPQPPSTGAAYGWSAHGEIEMPLVPRRWFVGGAHEMAAAALPGVGSKILLGNPEFWLRGVWSSVRGLASGGGFGLVVPAPRNPSEAEQYVLEAARTVRPWDAAYFADTTLVARPWFDIRLVTGPFIFQFRQGLDWSLVLRSLRPREPRYDLTARATFYFGYRASEAIGLGLEVWEVYQLSADPRVKDDQRASFAVSPSIRFMFPWVQPALSMLFPVTTPLRGDVNGYYALRLNVGFSFPTGRRSEPAPGL